MSTPAAIIHLQPPHPATLPDNALLKQCSLTRGKSQGPGGQHRNKVETKITLVHEPTGIEAHAGERRSQEQNRSVALFRLRLQLATHVRCPLGVGEIRTQTWCARVSPSGKIACNPEHHDFPAMLALALDAASASQWDLGKAAARLACTTSQLLKLIKDHPAACVLLNAQRQANNLGTLR